MNRFAAGVLIATLLAATAGVRAQNARIITFKDAVRIALDQNITVRQAQNAAALGKVDVSEARGQFLPDLRFSTTGAKNYGRSFDQTEGAIVDQTTKSLSLGINSSVTVFDGFGNVATLRGA